MSRPSVLVRFGVQADDGRHSSVWNVWTNESTYQGRRGDDIYLAVRQTAARAKVSPHASGQCRFSFTTRELHNVRWIGPTRPTDRQRRVGLSRLRAQLGHLQMAHILGLDG